VSVNIFNLETGTGNTIVFLHGWGLNSSIFNAIKTDCPKLFCEIGNPESLCDDLNDIIKKRNLGPVHLVGFSMGACLSVEFAERFPKLVISSTLLALGTRYEQAVLNDIKEHVSQNIPAYLRSFYKACFVDPADFKSFYAETGKQISEALSLESLLNGLKYLSTVSIQADDISESTQLFHGKHDLIAPLSHLSELDLNDSDHLQILPNSGHYVLYSDKIQQHVSKLS